MILVNRIALPMAAVAILLIGVGVGFVADLWRLSAIFATVAVVIVTIWAVARMQVASRALREIRTELRHIRAESRQTLLQVERFETATRCPDDEISQIHDNISELSSRVAVIADQQTQFMAEVEKLPRNDELESVRRQIDVRLEALAENLIESKALVARTKQQLNRSVRRQSETYGLLELLEGKLTARADYLVDEVQREMRKIRGQFATLSMRNDYSTEKDAMNSTVVATVAGDFDLPRYLYYLSYQIPREIEAMDQLVNSFQPMSRLPLLGGWALSPTGTLDVVNAIARQRPETVIECGSGTSTLWMAMAVRDNGRGHIFALEHDPAFADETRSSLAKHSLSEYATVIDAPIVENDISGRRIEWYDLREVREVQNVDMLVIDGPPEALGSLRGGAITLLSSRLSDGAHVFLDDVNRRSEQQLIRDWLAQYPQMQVQKSSTPVQAHLVWTTPEQE